MQQRNRLLFVAFVLSGFCGLLYQIVWLRLAFAQFGVITPVLSVLLSVFMLGLSVGSWAAGRWIEPLSARVQLSPLLLYGIVEICIGAWGLLVPTFFEYGARALLPLGDTSSFDYLFQSSLAITLAILPGCILMGMTFPLVAAYIRGSKQTMEHSFSFLYFANVIGATCGASLTALFLIELLGFRTSLLLGASVNLIVGLLSFWVNGRWPVQLDRLVQTPSGSTPSQALRGTMRTSATPRVALTVLFMTGFSSMAMEVAWTRAFTPIVDTTIYAFAFLLTSYLLATWVGSSAYRKHLRGGHVVDTETLLWWLALTAFFPLAFTDPRFQPTTAHVFFGLFPVCAILGYLTPRLVDDYSGGAARDMGVAYAVNILGCIAGPLAAGYVLLPSVGVKATLLLLALPFLGFVVGLYRRPARRLIPVAGLVLFALANLLFVTTYEDGVNYQGKVEVRRDHTATVIAQGQGMDKRLFINGIAITPLTPVTKIMAHFPLFSLKQPPESALVICFGMGTTFRSLVSWGIDVTAVELVPSVPDSFGFYFADAQQILSRPNARVIIDDGRRYLKRTSQQFDVVTLDPPPPVEAAGSSLLYSREFYEAVTARLKPGGIVQQWFPGGETKILESITAALVASFKHVRVYRSLEGWGYHFLASESPIEVPAAEAALAKTPVAAQTDLMEWFPESTPGDILKRIVAQEIPVSLALGDGGTAMLTDDRPFNEYFFLRRRRDVANGRYEHAR